MIRLPMRYPYPTSVVVPTLLDASARLLTGLLRATLMSLALITFATPTSAQDTSTDAQGQGSNEPLVVAVQEAPPFVIRDGDDAWSGISIVLWETAANELGLDYRFEEASLRDMVDGVADGRFDASIAAMSVTPRRERVVDFSHPYYTTGFAIATNPARTGWLQTVKSFFSPEFLTSVATLALVLGLVGVLFWLAERRGNPEEFRRDPIRGIGDGFWFSAVTMTTVGYGDKAPRTITGRVIALIWMFTAIIIISTFTGMIASSLTADRINATIRSPADLVDVETGTIGDSAGDDWMVDNGIAFTRFDSTREGLQAVGEGEIDAFVYDKPLLSYLTVNEFDGAITVGRASFGRQDYAIVLPDDSTLREDLNRTILDYLNTAAWDALKTQYLGEKP